MPSRRPAPPGAKRGPGRPPSKPPAPPLQLLGIVDAPQDAANRLEFASGEPAVFKALFTFFKNIKAGAVHIRCTPAGLAFFARDHGKTLRAVATIDGAAANWHYCEGEYWLHLNRAGVDKIFGSIDKSIYKISLIQTHEEPESLRIAFKDAELDKECGYEVKLSAFAPDPELYAAEAELAPAALGRPLPLDFVLGAKQFKKTVGDVANHCDHMNIEKVGAAPLQFTYDRDQLSYQEVYRDPAKIKLRSSVGPDDVFRCEVKVVNLKPFAASMVTDSIRIICRDEASDLICRSALEDSAVMVSVLVRIA